MESRTKVLGHPLHQMLIPLPFGLLTMAVVFDLVGAFGGIREAHIASYWMIAAGVVTGVVAAVPGAIDLLAIPRHTRAWGVGLVHGAGNVIVLTLFAISWLMRREVPTAPDSIAVILAVIGLLIVGVTGWLGGELVDRLGVGVDTGAHLDSPSSLSKRPAHEHYRAEGARRVEPPSPPSSPRTIKP